MHESPETLAWLQGIIDHSYATAGAGIRRNFDGPAGDYGDCRMSALELINFWGESRMASVSTVSASGLIHVVPLGPLLIDGRFYIPSFNDSQRLKDHRDNPRCAISSWEGIYSAVIIYGRASEVDQDPLGITAQSAAWQGYDRNDVLTVQVTPTRIYGIRPPPDHPAARDPYITRANPADIRG